MAKTKSRLSDAREASVRSMYVSVSFLFLPSFPLSPFFVCAGAYFLALCSCSYQICLSFAYFKLILQFHLSYTDYLVQTRDDANFERRALPR